jgi:hypothetical protein
MLRWLVPLMVLTAGPSFAMNWEGKEDWLDDLPQAQEFERHVPQARRGTLKPCATEPSGNPYEQVEIPGKTCVAVPLPVEPKR